MAILNTRELRARGAAEAGRCRQETGKLVLLYCGVIALLGLGSNGLQLYLDSQISQTGGLSGLGLRSMLQTIQSVLNYVNMFFGPFWSAGFLLAMMRLVRGGEPRMGDLTGGFRRLGAIMAGILFEIVVVIALLISLVNLASVIFALTPAGGQFAELMGPALTDPSIISPEGMVNMDLIPAGAIELGLKWMVPMTLLLFLPVYIWLVYSFRMATYLILDRPIGGFRAHFESMRLMRGHKWQLLKLDFGFWWYHVLGLLIGAVGYLDVILGLLGITLPVNEMVLYFGTLAAYFVLITGLYLWKKCDVDAAYVLAYEQIAYPEPVEAAE